MQATMQGGDFHVYVNLSPPRAHSSVLLSSFYKKGLNNMYIPTVDHCQKWNARAMGIKM